MKNITVRGIVLSSMPMDEYDRRLEILTAENGRISVFARGARKPSSSLVSASRVFAFGSFELFQGKNSYSLNSARIANYFTELSEDVELTYYGFYFLELARYFSREGVEGADMLKLVYMSLRALGLEQIDNRLIRGIYELKMLQINGICPSIEQIQKAEGRFSFAAGLSDSTLYAIQYVLSSEIGKLYTFKLKEENLMEFRKTSRALMNMMVDREFKSLELLEALS